MIARRKTTPYIHTAETISVGGYLDQSSALREKCNAGIKYQGIDRL